MSENQSIDLIKLCEFNSNTKFELIYKATRDGFKVSDFHAKCDNISKTFAIIKVAGNENIFGGYTEALWNSQIHANKPKHRKDRNAFIFSLVNNDNNPIKMKVKQPNVAICINYQYIYFFKN